MNSTEDKGHYFKYFLIPQFLIGFSEQGFLVNEQQMDLLVKLATMELPDNNIKLVDNSPETGF